MYNINVNMSLVRVIESWATTENPFNSTDEILAWIQENNKAVEVSIRKIPYDYSGENWHYDSERGEIRNKTGSFFRIKGLQKIVDVAIRALSPGINDPNTAVQCIHYLSEALIKNFKYTGTYVIYNDENHLGRLVVRRSSVEDKLYKMLSQISFYGRQDVTILRTLIEALENIALNSTDDVKRDIEAFSRYVYDGFDEDVLYDIDYKYINERQVRLSEALNRAE